MTQTLEPPTDNEQQTGLARRVTPITEPIDRANVGAIQVKDSKGGVSFNNMIELMDFAKLMAVSQTAVPKHLRGNPGACLAVCLNAVEWRMSPFAVANKSYSVNDRLAYESAVFHAVASQRAPIKGRVKMRYAGKGETRVCTVWADLADGTGTVEYESPEFGKIQPKNSPLWKNDPDQQLFYFSVRGWVRRHFPDVMMGVYADDELQDTPPETVVQETPQRGAAALTAKLKGRHLEETQLPEDEAARYIEKSRTSETPPPSSSDATENVSSPDARASATAAGVDEAEQESHQQPEAPADPLRWPENLPAHAHTSPDWIDDMILKVKPADMTGRRAKELFHAQHKPNSWAALTDVQRFVLYVELKDGEFKFGK